MTRDRVKDAAKLINSSVCYYFSTVDHRTEGLISSRSLSSETYLNFQSSNLTFNLIDTIPVGIISDNNNDQLLSWRIY